MKKLFLFCIIIAITLISGLYAYSKNTSSEHSKFIGRWAEEISERVVLDIYQNKDSEYSIFITWREDNLAQKDIYRFKAKNDNGILKYNNGIHIYRTFEGKTKYKDKVDYKDGTGEFKLENNKIIWKDNKDKTESIFIKANKNLCKDTTVSNKYFSIMLPEELKGFYEAKISKDTISIYDKASKIAGFGGFAFAIRIYKNPSDHAVLPGSKKLGELTDKNNILYDVVLKHPTDVQYDYTKGTKAPDRYALMYEFGDIVSIKGKNKSQYHKNQGTKGKDLYRQILQKHLKAVNEHWDSSKLEKENMSYMYNVMSEMHKNVADKIGYTYYDINGDGIDELIIGEIAEGNWKGVIYDIYTMVNRKPKHVVSGGERDRYYVCNDVFVCNEYSSGAFESGVRVYILVENSVELYPQVSFKYDGYENKKNPWFLSYGHDDDKWENVSEQIYEERIKHFEKYNRFDYIPLSNVK